MLNFVYKEIKFQAFIHLCNHELFVLALLTSHNVTGATLRQHLYKSTIIY